MLKAAAEAAGAAAGVPAQICGPERNKALQKEKRLFYEKERFSQLR